MTDVNNTTQVQDEPLAHPGAAVANLMADDLGYELTREQVRAQLFGARTSPKIGRFEIERKLGSGGMGEVLLARDPELRRPVAIKLLLPALRGPQSSHSRERVRREAQALAQVNHPNIVEVYEVGEHQGQPYVAMEYIEGRTLAAWLALAKPRWREIVEVYLEAARGLLAAHRAGLVHRDFKPDNVLISESGGRRVRVVDFGLARLDTGDDKQTKQAKQAEQTERTGEDSQDGLTSPGALLGTIAFMSPEQLHGELATAASDQFSFCLALYLAIWDQPAFEGRSVDQLRFSMAGNPRQPPRGAAVPSAVWRILRRGLMYLPRERWPDMAELIAALEQTIAQRRRWPALLLVGALAGAGAGVGGMVLQTAEPEDPCRYVDARSAELWSAERAERAKTQFAASTASFADASFTSVDTALGQWSEAWSGSRRAVCESGDDQGRRASCLDRIHAEAVPLVDALVEADEQTVEHAVASLDILPSISTCDDDEASLLGLAAIPSGRESEIAEARKTLARAHVAYSTTHYDEAARLFGELELEALDYPPFAAELAVARANLELARLDPEESLPMAHAAAILAEKARHDRLAARSWTLLAHRGANRLEGPHELTATWIERGEVASARLDHPPDLEARLLCIQGVLLGGDESQVVEARATVERGLALLDSPAIDAVTRLWRPVCLADLAKLHEGPRAIELAEQALAAAEQVYGVSHAEVAGYCFELARLLLDEGEPLASTAKPLLERAAEVWLAKYGESTIQVADAYTSLATVAVYDGDLELARKHAVAANAIYDRMLAPDDHQHGQPLLLEASIAMQLGEHATALDFFTRARPFATGPGLEDTLAQIDRSRAECLRALGRVVEAEAIE